MADQELRGPYRRDWTEEQRATYEKVCALMAPPTPLDGPLGAPGAVNTAAIYGQACAMMAQLDWIFDAFEPARLPD